MHGSRRAQPHCGPILATVLLAAVLALEVTALAQSSITYIYDSNGRLKAVIDPSANPASNVAVYTYDAAGNILSIERRAASALAILAFSPNCASTGTVVTISGTGFSTTPSSNAVTFNGVAATVSSATATELVTTVPAGAASGVIAVTVSAVTVMSPTVFTVGCGAPTITSFTTCPGTTCATSHIGTPGTAVTIEGTNFSTVAADNRVSFHRDRFAVLTPPATATSLLAQVPQTAVSGRIAVATQYGTAVSAEDFFVPPTGKLATDVQVTGRLTPAFGSPASGSATLSAAGKLGMFVFDGTPGWNLSLVSTQSTTFEARFIRPSGGELSTHYPLLSTPARTPPLPEPGTYTLRVMPTTAAGTVNFTLHAFNDLFGTIAAGAPPGSQPVTLTAPAQDAYYSFSPPASGRVALAKRNDTLNEGTGIRAPSGAWPLQSTPSSWAGPVTLSEPGTHTLVVDGVSTSTGSVTVDLWAVPPDQTGLSVLINGATQNVNVVAPTQNPELDLPFSGTPPVNITVNFGWLAANFTSASGASASKCFYFRLKKADGTLVAQSALDCSPPGSLAATLSETGTFKISIDNHYDFYGGPLQVWVTSP